MDAGTFLKPSLTEVAYEEIKKSILNGAMPPGHKLVVNDLVSEWKISNTPIKEALNRLITEGLVETLPRRGMRVRVFSPKEIRDIFDLRAVYEVHCCRMAVDAIARDPGILADLRAVCAQMGEILEEEYNYVKQYELDKIFHTRLVSLCGNDMLIREFGKLRANILSFMFYASNKLPLWRQADTHIEHNRILDALAAGDKAAVTEAMQVHLANTCRDVLLHV